MMRFVLLCCFGLIFAPRAAFAEDAVAPKPAARACAAVEADLAAARAAGNLKDVAKLYAEAEQAAVGCEPKALFCMGRGAALAHVEAAYAAAATGRGAEAAGLFEAGRRFGEPWPLLVGLGDAAVEKARATHDGKQWSDASIDFQTAISVIDEPALCEGEPQVPDQAGYDGIVRKMSLATLLAKPLTFFHSKCAPCSLAFLAHGPVAAERPRVVPITFEDRSAAMTSEGAATAKALLECAVSQKWTKLGLSIHTDDRGSDAVNQALSQQRIVSVRKVFTDGGFKGALDTEAKGKSEPLQIDDPKTLTAAEVQRANRRVEVRSIAGESVATCAGPQAQVP